MTKGCSKELRCSAFDTKGPDGSDAIHLAHPEPAPCVVTLTGLDRIIYVSRPFAAYARCAMIGTRNLCAVSELYSDRVLPPHAKDIVETQRFNYDQSGGNTSCLVANLKRILEAATHLPWTEAQHVACE
eukprot:2132006-Amphidinium_carterae.1